MRLRFVLLAAPLAAVLMLAMPALASAAPRHNSGLTINATPNPIIAGEGVLIYGQLRGRNVANQPVRLYRRLYPYRQFVALGTTTTNAFGLYEFTRQVGIVYTNRSWFVRGPSGTHSRTVRERVAALVSLHPDRTTADTRQSVTFSGHVTPNHAFERVLLQVQKSASNDWRTLAATRLDRGSNYSLSYRWRIPGERSVRVLLRRDARNITSVSDAVSVTIEQAQVPDFTINTTAPVIDFPQSATLSGTLYKHGTTTPEPGTPVTLCGRTAYEPQFICDTATVTGSDGSYSFTVSPQHNELYFVQTTLAPHRHTALLFEGVRDVVTLSVTPSSANTSQLVAFTGTVTPDKAGDVVYLQRLGADHDWHTVGAQLVHRDSSFGFVRRFGTAGGKTFRARVLPDPGNVGGASPPVTVMVSQAPVSQLPPAH